MNDLILIPSFYRPEFLYLTLEYIAKAKGGLDKEVWVAQDMKTNDVPGNRILLHEVVWVTKQFEGKFKKFKYIQRQPNSYIGNPYNFMELYKEAFAHQDARYVYLIEDDVLVAPDFFEWHEAVQRRGDYFCTVGWHCIRNPLVKKTENPHDYVETSRDYSSIGVCWRRQNLAKLVPHADHAYYGHMAAYLGKAFPGNPIPAGQWTEQAGVIMRILLGNKNLFVAWAGLRRCAHVGLHGYHRKFGYRFKGVLGNKIDQLKKAIETKQLISMLKQTDDDVELPIETPPWMAGNLRVTQRFICDGTTGLGKGIL